MEVPPGGSSLAGAGPWLSGVDAVGTCATVILDPLRSWDRRGSAACPFDCGMARAMAVRIAVIWTVL